MRALKLLSLAAVFGVSLLSVKPALAAPIVFSGYDVGSGSLATSPNATAAANAFIAALGSASLIDFETGLPAGVTLVGGSITDTSGCPAALCGYATSGTMFDLQSGGSQTFTFATPIDAFGAFFTGWQISTQTLTYSNGLVVVLNMPAAIIDQGGTVFFGFIDPTASIVSVTYNSINDIVALDDVRFRTSAVPEPATLLLLGTGLGAVAARRRKRR